MSSATPTERCFPFSKTQRLLSSSDFTPVFNDAPIRASNSEILILCKFSSTNNARLGLVVAKKHIKHANKRNQFKRIARESFRLKQHKLPPIDAIVLARRGADALSKNELRRMFDGLWKRVVKKAEKLAQAQPEKTG